MVFSSRIRNAPFPQRYQPPTNITRYADETNPGLWLKDYQHTHRSGGTNNDYFIIRNLQLFLANMAQTWLEHLPAG